MGGLMERKVGQTLGWDRARGCYLVANSVHSLWKINYVTIFGGEVSVDSDMTSTSSSHEQAFRCMKIPPRFNHSKARFDQTLPSSNKQASTMPSWVIFCTVARTQPHCTSVSVLVPAQLVYIYPPTTACRSTIAPHTSTPRPHDPHLPT